jgi:hypothetical protein
MLEAFRIEEAKIQNDNEARYLEEIRQKMEMIKKSASASNSDHRFTMCHDHAIMSGGYFMFDNENSSNEVIEPSNKPNEPEKVQRTESKRNVKFESKESVEGETVSLKTVVIEKSKTVKHISLSFLQKLMLRMNKLSRNYSFIIKTMAHEKKLLKDSVTPAKNDSSVLV